MMKNERIITHYKSYTSAQGCVKDLIPYFSGRISIASPAAPNRAAKQADEPPADNPLDDVLQIGGIALGALAYLIPGMSPMITGGPAAGSAIGQTVGFYMESQMADSDKWDEDFDENEQKRHGPFFVWLDVRSDDEAQIVDRIVRQHGGTPEYIPIDDEPRTQDEPDYTFDPPGDDIPDGYPQLTGQAQRRIPHVDGYDLDPLPPVSPQNYVDPNIGYGNFDLIDPAGVFKDDKTD